MHGWIILDKPSGITSAHAVAKVKGLLRSRSQMSENRCQTGSSDIRHQTSGIKRTALKIGHAGTLDPLASGVLPLALGEATKTVPYMMDAAKAYEFTVTWGQQRDTDDCEGKITQTSDKRPTRAEIESSLPQFIGQIRQTPPAFSAIKVDGRRAYDMARAGEEVELKAREVQVFDLKISDDRCRMSKSAISDIQHPASDIGCEATSFLCHCSKGTYIRSLARDMGRALGCFGHISVLRRIKVGKFDQAHAISLERLEKEVYKGGLGFLRPVESALDDIPAVNVSETQAAQLKRGQNVVLPLSVDSSTVIARCNDKLVAICEWKDSRLKPVRVFNL